MSEVTTVSRPKGWQERLRESRMGTILVLAVTAGLVMVGAYLVDRPSPAELGVQPVSLTGPGGGAAPKIGSASQDFTATTVDGEKVSLSQYKGQPVWLTFGASWCAACKAEAADMEAAYKKHKAAGLVILQVSISEDSATVKDYTSRIGLTFPQIADPDTRIASAYRVNGIPAHYFIDRSGVLRLMTTGGQSPDQMDAAVAKIS